MRLSSSLLKYWLLLMVSDINTVFCSLGHCLVSPQRSEGKMNSLLCKTKQKDIKVKEEFVVNQ